jgi:hypothetical protein
MVSSSGETTRVGFGKKRFDESFKVFHGVVIVHDLDGMGEVIQTHFFQTKCSVHKHHHVVHTSHAASQSFAPQADAKVRGAFKSGQIGGGLIVAQRSALVVELMLGEHAAKGSHACLGLAIGGLSFAPFEFLAPHRHSGVIRLNVENFGIAGLGRTFAAQPFGGGWSHTQNFTLDLAFSHGNAPHFLEMKRGLLVAGFIGAFQAYEPSQRRCVTAFQTEGLVGGMAALLLAGVVVVVALQGGVAKNSLDLDGLAAFADFARLGLVCGIDLVSGFLKKLADKKRGGFENGGAQQFFKIGDEGTTGLGGAKGVDQLLDFFLAGEVEGFLG